MGQNCKRSRTRLFRSYRINKLLSLSKESFWSWIYFVIGALIYTAVFHWVYINFLVRTREYFGFLYLDIDNWQIFMIYACCMVPSFFFPLKPNRPSKYLYFLIYILILIPTFFTITYSWKHPVEELVKLNIALVTGFLVTGLQYNFSLLNLKTIKFNRKLYSLSIVSILLLLFIPVIIYTRSSLNFVTDINSGDIYSQRFIAGDIIASNRFIGYGMTLSAGCILPILMARAILNKRRINYIIGTFCYLLLYGIGANKSYLFAPLFMMFIYFMLKSRGNFFTKFIYTGGLSMFIVAFFQTFGSALIKKWLVVPSSILIMRIIGNSGVIMIMYYNFFRAGNPLTYYSHVSGINKIIPFPYEKGLSLVVGDYYSVTSNSRYNPNANYLVTDGLSSAWLPGIIYISIFMAFVFWILDSSLDKKSTYFGILSLTYIGINIANWPIFTTLVSGGLLLLITFHFLMPKNAVSSKWR